MTESALDKALDSAYNREAIEEWHKEHLASCEMCRELEEVNDKDKPKMELSPRVEKPYILNITDILNRLDKMESKLEELERKITDGDKQMTEAVLGRSSIRGRLEIEPICHKCGINVDGPYIDSFIGFKNGLEGPKYILTCVTCAMSAKQPQPQPNPDEINDPISRFKPYEVEIIKGRVRDD